MKYGSKAVWELGKENDSDKKLKPSECLEMQLKTGMLLRFTCLSFSLHDL